MAHGLGQDDAVWGVIWESATRVLREGVRFEEALPRIREEMGRRELEGQRKAFNRWEELLATDYSTDKDTVVLWLQRAFPEFEKQPLEQNALHVELGEVPGVFALYLEKVKLHLVAMGEESGGKHEELFPGSGPKVFHADYRAEELTKEPFRGGEMSEQLSEEQFAWLWLMFTAATIAERFRGMNLERELGERPLLHLIYGFGERIGYGGTLTMDGWVWREGMPRLWLVPRPDGASAPEG